MVSAMDMSSHVRSSLDLVGDETISSKQKDSLVTFIKGLQDADPFERKVYKKSETGLARTVVALSKDEIYVLLNSQKRSDKVLGAGAAKTVKTAIDVVGGQKVATYSIKMDKETADELKLRQTFGSMPHLQQPILNEFEYMSKKGTKTRVFDTLYSSDLLKLVPTDETSDAVLSEDQKKQVSKDLCYALKVIHDHGFYHRDIKPDNILVRNTADGFECDIADFGIMVAKEDKESQIVMKGSPKYLSPEYIAYQSVKLEEPPERAVLLAQKKEMEDKLLSLIDPEKKVKGSAYGLQLMRFNKAHPDPEDPIRNEVDALALRIKEVSNRASELKPQRDFSTVTSEKHDIYAMGLTLYALATSQKALDEFIAKRDLEYNTAPSFHGYGVKPELQEVLMGMLHHDPAARMTLEEAIAKL